MKKIFALQQFVASMLFASILPPRRQDLERHVETLQHGEPVEVVAETGAESVSAITLLGTSMVMRKIVILYYGITDTQMDSSPAACELNNTIFNMKPPLT